jgi:hypothetical protein
MCGSAGFELAESFLRHGRAWPGHPLFDLAIKKTWMPAPSAGMTIHVDLIPL